LEKGVDMFINESSKYVYEIFEDPNREGCASFYILKYKKKKSLHFFNRRGPPILHKRVVGYRCSMSPYFNTLDDAIIEIRNLIIMDDPEPQEPHKKVWP
jgi:hypothetical protein